MNYKKKLLSKLITSIIVLSISIFFVLLSNLDSKSPLRNENKNHQSQVSRVNTGVTLEGINIGELTYIKLNDILIRLSENKKKKPQNAFSFNNQIKPATFGRKVNIPATINKILKAAPDQDIKLAYDRIPPTITEEILIERKVAEFKFKNKHTIRGKLLAHYATYLKDNRPQRRNNIMIALKEINNYYLKPSEEFSFNELIGYPTSNKGYQKAPIINLGRIVPKTGGGICQVSSTLYNVVRKANIKITEHYHHSQPVSYVPQGQDATIVPGQKDFKFLNNTKKPIMILTDIIGRYVIIYLIQEESYN